MPPSPFRASYIIAVSTELTISCHRVEICVINSRTHALHLRAHMHWVLGIAQNVKNILKRMPYAVYAVIDNSDTEEKDKIG
jgi:hypothetical protein